MAGICSAHQGFDPDCRLCGLEGRDILPDYDAKMAEAEAAGRTTCACGYVHYRTISLCPLCGTPTPTHERLVPAGNEPSVQPVGKP